MRITKREVLVSIAIISIMLLIGLVIHGNINDRLMLEYQKYNTALQIDNDSELFNYGIKTNIGNAFVYGDLKAVDTVTYPEIGGEYSYVKKVKEKYTKHTRIVTYTDSDGDTHTKIEEYWTWDYVDSWSKHCNKISFLDVEFDYGAIDFPSSHYITTQKESSKIRYKYYGTDTKFTGTIYTELNNNTVNNSKFHNNMNIKETMESMKSGWQLILFWFFWIALTGCCVYGFYYLDNWWLE